MSFIFRCATLFLLGLLLISIGCNDVADVQARPESSAVPGVEEPHADPVTEATDHPKLSEQEKLTLVNRMRPAVDKFCGDCHSTSPPESSTIEEWIDEVDQGFMLYQTSGRTDLEVPDRDDVLKFFQYQAPEKLILTNGIAGYPQSPVPFERITADYPDNRPPGITHIQWIDLGIKPTSALVYCDIGTGAVKAHWPSESGRPTVRLGTVLQPVHVAPCDLDRDGKMDLVIADIGEFNANESDLGQIVWLHRSSKSSTESANAQNDDKFEKTVLLDGLSRLADVRPADFDGDGDIDLLVAAFGWRTTGKIFLMRNENRFDEGVPQFTVETVDDRHGPIHVPPIDLNNDGHLDFIALFGQEHERVEAFLNDGDGNFNSELLWAAPNPAYGSSGIQLADLDGDGDVDVLYTNGDSFDRGAKPHHSVQWLENEGSYPWKHHPLINMPGAMAAQAADFDGDGDLDVIATSLLVGDSQKQVDAVDSSSIVLLLQTSKGEFTPTKIEAKSHQHLALRTADFDGDGKLDVAVGNFLRNGPKDQPDLILLYNAGE
ncbi:secreted protein [Rhodopirellula maiorica SM1]|uniref:Secreted protein n=1 Tax=Rhodopirellula maiorica SM1 TaxID=1265738 RepID=M5RPV3_9BACT|nr:VCBS repeat-containing protein [Rhodopirellula maiorica]EMI21310.1 secreted protein [Rhodopirellula maiorica SM1]